MNALTMGLAALAWWVCALQPTESFGPAVMDPGYEHEYLLDLLEELEQPECLYGTPYNGVFYTCFEA
jgi:hypothetical protein